MAAPKRQARNYCFTLNNHGDVEMEYPPPIGYCVYQFEVAPDTGMRHFQGYVEFDQMMTLQQVHDLGGQWSHVHLEARRGTQEQAIAYCKKDDSREPPDFSLDAGEEGPVGPPKIVEFGVPAQARVKRSFDEDMKALQSLIKGGADEEDLALNEPHLFKSYRQFIQPLIGAFAKQRKRAGFPLVAWIYGPPGCGKSSAVTRHEPDLYEVKFDDGAQCWMEGYTGQEAVLFDDFRDSYLPFMKFCTYLNELPPKFSQRGKKPVWNVANRIYITTPYHPEQTYMGVVENKYQLYRRIKFVWNAAEVNAHAKVKWLMLQPNKPFPPLPEVEPEAPEVGYDEWYTGPRDAGDNLVPPSPPPFLRQNGVWVHDSAGRPRT